MTYEALLHFLAQFVILVLVTVIAYFATTSKLTVSLLNYLYKHSNFIKIRLDRLVEQEDRKEMAKIQKKAKKLGIISSSK